MPTSKIPLVPGTKTLTRGSIVAGNASGEPAALAIGSNTYVLKSDGTDISWGADAGGAALTGSTNNTVTTVTGANAIQGETNFIYNGTIVGCGPDGANADLGVGLHIKTADSGATAATQADELVIESDDHAGLSILTGTDKKAYINFGDSGDNGIGRVMYDHNTNTMRFLTSGNDKMRIASGGQVIITDNNFSGTPLGDDTAAQNGRLHVKGSSGNEIAVFQTASNGRQIQFYNAGATYVGGIAINSGDTTYATSSDYRLKENETSITDGIDRIKQLKPYRFNFKTDTNKTVDGFFAHEVSSIVPEAITGTKDAMHPEVLYTADDELPEGKNIGDVKEATKINPQGIDQSKLVPLLASALQEAITKIETLETKVTALESA